jgi:hypothetical protein
VGFACRRNFQKAKGQRLKRRPFIESILPPFEPVYNPPSRHLANLLLPGISEDMKQDS